MEAIHQVYHFVTIALALSKNHEVSILTYPGKHTLLRSLLNSLDGGNVNIIERPTMLFRAITDSLKGREKPRRGFWIKKNQNYILSNFDAVIFTDYYHHYLLKARGSLKRPKFIKLPHGLPGRSYSYREDQKDFDFQLIYGSFHERKLAEKNLLADHYAIMGLPKLDAIPSDKPNTPFKDKKPIVLYTPHFAYPLSSWHDHGVKILEYFSSQDTYNLLFAPHINLFKKIKKSAEASEIPKDFFNTPNIHIDLGSQKSVDMSYLRLADIYLGDISSQVYEFITSPRPCVFVNAKNVDYSEDLHFRFWQCGPVIQSVTELPNALKKSVSEFDQYKKIQKKLNAVNYYTEKGTTPSKRAADAITSYLKNCFSSES